MYTSEIDPIARPGSGTAGLRRALPGDRWAFYLPLGFLLFLEYWWTSTALYPGFALACCGFALAVLLIRSNVSRMWEKAIWMLFAVSLFAVELHAAHQAHVCANSFLELRLVAPDQSIVDAHGTASIHSASMSVVDFDQFTRLQDEHVGDATQYERVIQVIPLGDFRPETQKVFCLRPAASHQGIAHYRITFSNSDGFWWEDLQAATVNGRLLQASRIVRYRSLKAQVVAEQADPGYPFGPSGVLDWGWAAREP